MVRDDSTTRIVNTGTEIELKRPEKTDDEKKKKGKTDADYEHALQAEGMCDEKVRETAWNITRKLSERRRANVRTCHPPAALVRALIRVERQ